MGESKKHLSDFPDDAKTDAGHQLFLVQQGENPIDWKPVSNIGVGVREIRTNTKDGWYRVFYIARLSTGVYVLHAFQKKSNKTSKSDISLGKSRFKEALAHDKENRRN